MTSEQEHKVKKEILGFPAPARAFDSKYYDKNCPFTGGLAVKKELLKGKVIRRDINKSATIEWHRPYYIPKYERYEMRRSRLRVHNPPALDAQVGQTVVVARTRPLSKTKNHVIIHVVEETATKGATKETNKTSSLASPEKENSVEKNNSKKKETRR